FDVDLLLRLLKRRTAAALAVARLEGVERRGDVERAIGDLFLRRLPRAGAALRRLFLRVDLGEPLAEERVVRKARGLFVQDRARVVEQTTRREDLGLFERLFELGRRRRDARLLRGDRRGLLRRRDGRRGRDRARLRARHVVVHRLVEVELAGLL